MDDRVVIFERSEVGGDWYCADEEASLCSSGLKDYVGIPEHIHEFDAVFSTDRPDDVDVFEVYNGKLDIAGGIDFFENASEFLIRIYQDGFRYLHVRY